LGTLAAKTVISQARVAFLANNNEGFASEHGDLTPIECGHECRTSSFLPGGGGGFKVLLLSIRPILSECFEAP